MTSRNGLKQIPSEAMLLGPWQLKPETLERMKIARPALFERLRKELQEPYLDHFPNASLASRSTTLRRVGKRALGTMKVRASVVASRPTWLDIPVLIRTARLFEVLVAVRDRSSSREVPDETIFDHAYVVDNALRAAVDDQRSKLPISRAKWTLAAELGAVEAALLAASDLRSVQITWASCSPAVRRAIVLSCPEHEALFDRLLRPIGKTALTACRIARVRTRAGGRPDNLAEQLAIEAIYRAFRSICGTKATWLTNSKSGPHGEGLELAQDMGLIYGIAFKARAIEAANSRVFAIGPG